MMIHDVLLTARMFLEQLDFDVTVLSDPEKILPRLKKESFDVILLDMNFQRGQTEGAEGLRWLENIREQDSGAVVILMTAFGDVDLAVKGIRAGAFDFILKPWQNAKLHASILSAIETEGEPPGEGKIPECGQRPWAVMTICLSHRFWGNPMSWKS